MVCSGLEILINANTTGLGDILAYPTSCDYYFYAKIMAAFFIVITFIIYYGERDRFKDPDLLSAAGVSALATIFVTFAASLVGLIQTDVFIEILVAGLVIVAIWLLKK